MDNVQLIACDMDRTLLTEDKKFPPGFWEGLARLRDLGILFVPASGRPLPTLKEMFKHPDLDLAFISDNGSLVEYQGEILQRSRMEPGDYMPMVEATVEDTDGVPVICCERDAYTLPSARKYAEYLGVYYLTLHYTNDLGSIEDVAVKYTSYFDKKDARTAYDDVFVPSFGVDYAVTLGGPAWVDIMNPGVTKALGVEALAGALDLGRHQMMAFGDALNDLEMLDAVEHSYAVANADPEILKRAKHRTASNEEFGVMRVINELIGRRQGD